MIEIKNLEMKFDEKSVLDNINLKFENGYIYGIIGANGAGKSTLLRIMSGVYRGTGGEVLYDNKVLDTNKTNFPNLVFLSDNIYYKKNDTIKSLADEYRQYYPQLSYKQLKSILDNYKLTLKQKIVKLSKGQKNQMRIAIALSCNADYILLDETLDGLDPMMRINTKKIIYNEIADTDKIVIITSHSLREMEDMCDNLIVLHDNTILLSDKVENVKGNYIKLRCAFSRIITANDFEDMDIVSIDGKKIVTMVIKGERGIILKQIKAHNALVVEEIPLSLEEVFLIKMNEIGYGELTFDGEAEDEK